MPASTTPQAVSASSTTSGRLGAARQSLCGAALRAAIRLRRQTISDLENEQSWTDAVTVHRVAVVLGLDSQLRADPHGPWDPADATCTGGTGRFCRCLP
jgi:hypothetical protein